MHPTSSHRGTPHSGENITRIVRQHYKPASPEPYSLEPIQCRTNTQCKTSKPDNYWLVNYHRRKYNLDKGFYTAPTETYKPIGGKLILDPYELVLSALPGTIEKKFQPRVTRRGTIYEPDSPRLLDTEENKSDKESLCLSEDLVDSCPSAGFEDIKRLVRESRERIVNVRAGMAYEDHVKQVEEIQKVEEEANRSDEDDMTLQSLSSMCQTIHTIPLRSPSPPPRRNSSLPSSCPGSRRGSRPASSANDSPTGRQNQSRPDSAEDSDRPRATWRGFRPTYSDQEKKKNLVVNHFGKPGSSMKPASPDQSPKKKLLQCSSGITAILLRKERQLKDHFLYLKWICNILAAIHNMKVKDIRSKVPLSKELVEKLQKEGQCQRDDERASRGTYAPSRFGKNTRTSRASSIMEMENDDGQRSLSIYGSVKRNNALDTINKNFFGRRRSIKAAGLGTAEKPLIETWEDLLNVQAPEYKELETPSVGLQFGIVKKFMKWFKRASITPTFAGGPVSTDKDQLSQLAQKQEKVIQPEPSKETNYGVTHHQSINSAQAVKEKTIKLPIWQLVAQEKSVFLHKITKTHNPETAIQRFRRDFNKMKQSLQKENNAELEKLVRERGASFHLKFGLLNSEEASPLFEEQVHRINEVKDNVNKAQLENFDVLPSKWYEELRERTETMIQGFEQPQIMERINKLQTYAHMDNKTVPYAKAKLCLLMMSLPAYDICQIYVQRSLKFVFENILLGTDAQFNEWLSHRKIPFMVVQHDDQRPNSAANTVSFS